MRKHIALFLCLCLLAAVLTGCGGNSRIEYYEDEPAQEAEAAAEADANPPVEAAADGAAGPGFNAYPADTVVATVNGEPVTWEEYCYWLTYYVDYVKYLAAMNGFALSGWDAHEVSSSNTNGEVVLLNAQYAVVQYHVMSSQADALGYGLDEADLATMQLVFDQTADSTVGDGDGVCSEEEAAAFNEYLAQQNVSRELFDFMNEVSLLNEKTFIGMYGQSGELLSDEEALAFADAENIRAAKHILLLTLDEQTGEPLSDEELAQKRATIEDLYAQLSAVAGDTEALNALFDQLMAEYTEDTGIVAFPTGYTYVPGVMVAEFEDAVNALEEYEMSDVVETSYGYHIIMRVPVGADDTVMDTSGQAVILRLGVANQQFTEIMNSWMDEANVVWNDGFETLDIAAVFGGAG